MKTKIPEVGYVITISNKYKVQQGSSITCGGCIAEANIVLCTQLPTCGEVSERTGLFHNKIIFVEDDGEQ
jgi:hypothetical protein